MSKWGVFEAEDGQHIAPCSDDGYVLPPHQLGRDCPCGPREDPRCPGQWIHHDPERGGFNA